MALSEQVHQQEDQHAPPHLRMATGNEGCANCRFFEARSVQAGACTKYDGYPVRPSQMCDSWAPQAAQADRAQESLGAQVSQPMQGA